MAAEFNSGILTSQGLALLARCQAGECVPKIKRAAAGNGSYSSEDVLASMTELKSEMMSVGISGLEIQNDSTLIVKFVLNNEELTAGFRVTEIGIFVEDPDDSSAEILYSIATSADEETADYLPAYNGTFASVIVFNYMIEVANADSVTFTQGLGAYALADDLQALSAQVTALNNSGLAYMFTYDITIPADGWETSEDEETAGYLYVDIEQEDITEDMVPLVIIKPQYLYIAKTCGLSASAQTLDGVLRLYSESAPSEEMEASLALLIASGTAASGSGTVSTYTLPTATATTLGGVKIGNGLTVTEDGTVSVDQATSDETEEMLDDTFGDDDTSSDTATEEEVEEMLDDTFGED